MDDSIRKTHGETGQGDAIPEGGTPGNDVPHARNEKANARSLPWFWKIIRAMRLTSTTFDGPECDPNEPCREVQPEPIKGVKFKFKF